MRPIPGADEPGRTADERIVQRITQTAQRRESTRALRDLMHERRTHGLRRRHQIKTQRQESTPMQRLTKTLETSIYRHPNGGTIVLPDVATYGHPLLADAFGRLTSAADANRTAHDHLDKLQRQARDLGSHDAQQMADAEQAASDAHQAQAQAYLALRATLAEHTDEIREHHRRRRAQAVDRIRALADELRQAATDYAAETAMLNTADGQLVASRGQVPGLLALDYALSGDGLDSPYGLETALKQIA
ncbi:hypothetical protein ACFYOK_10775 [Microbispora bryophytorum]|uniref:hypothetical protein n=1 Tax=Microbispora bryophytorum TaxID=1460882 RepID=UPI0033C878F9